MRLALLSNVTVEMLADMLSGEHSIWLPSGFGAWMETALNPPAELVEFDPEVVFILLDSSRAEFDGKSCAIAKSAMEAAFPRSVVIVPDLAGLADDVAGFYDERMWKLAAMPWSMAGLLAVKEELARLLRLLKGGRKKVLALDFDNTLWAGVVGEDGVAAIRPFEEFQRGLKGLVERGVLLVGISKNNPADVAPAWQAPHMVIGEGDFAAMRINWRDKPSNIAELADELNLGVDSFVFVDDNPVGREEMRMCLPEVEVPEFPAAEGDLPKFLRRIARLYFPEMRSTPEDLARTAQYRAEAARRDFGSRLSIDDYLKGLGMWADIHPVREDEMPRAAQLSQKSNQFNVLSNRYAIDDIARFAADSGRLLLTVHAGDRFGDMGLVSFVHVRIEGDEAEVLDWVMSCRAMNRRLEFAVEGRLEEILNGRGVESLCAKWRKTAKNEPVSRLFDTLGFVPVEATEQERRYRLDLPRAVPLAGGSHVAVKAAPNCP